MNHDYYDDFVDPIMNEMREGDQIEDLFAELEAELYPV